MYFFLSWSLRSEPLTFSVATMGKSALADVGLTRRHLVAFLQLVGRKHDK